MAEYVKLFVLFRCLLAFFVTNDAASPGKRREYVAAVYEHAVVSANRLCANRSDALEVIQRNLDTLAAAAQDARKHGVDVIVFPEYGITGLFSPSRTPRVELFFETVPDPTTTSWCPCNATAIVGSEIQQYLSCLARNNSMYIVANMGDIQPCQPPSHNCRPRGYYLFNTNVAFAPDGCLVARYHKENLFLSEALILDVPPRTEYAVFETDFGRFGLFTCFDVVFKAPAIDLVEQYGIDSVAFPTAWMNVLPYYSAIAYHSGWARGMKVNFLAANLHIPQSRMVGSGIYSPSGPLIYKYNASSQSGILLVTTVPILDRRYNADDLSELLSGSGIHRLNAHFLQSKHGQLPPAQQHFLPVGSYIGHTFPEFSAYVFGDLFTFVALEARSGSARVCQKDVCCSVHYTRSDESEDKVALGAFDGIHTLEGTYYLQICLVVTCLQNANGTSCGTPSTSSAATFSLFTLKSTTSTKYIFPEVLTIDNELAPREWKFSKRTVVCGNTTCWKSVIRGSFEKSLISSALVGRHYDRDAWNYNDDHLRRSFNSDMMLYSNCSVSACHLLLFLNLSVFVNFARLCV